jgi:RNA polymerase sigma-70 factor (ECF subfamily)
VVNAFLTASRGGEFDALLAVVDPDVVVRADHAAIALGALSEVRGAPAVATRSLTFSWCTRFSQPALVNGAGGVVVAPRDRLSAVMLFTIRHGKIAEIDALADPARLRQLDLAVLAG